MEGNNRQIFPQNGVIFLEGSRSMCMYFVHSGRVGIYSRYGTAEQKLLTALEPGSFFGEMGMVRGFPRSASAVALLPNTEVGVVTWETLGDYFRTEPAKVVGIMQQMADRIADLTNDYIGACGEITRLLDERSRLEERRLSQESSQPAPRRNSGAETNPKTERKTEKSQGNEDSRLKKYVDAYRRYENAGYALDPRTGDLLTRI